MFLADESHLLLSLLLSAAVSLSALRCAKWVCDGSFSKAICDALLLFALIVYLAVGMPAILHCLNLATMCIAALTLAASSSVICPGKAPTIQIRWSAQRWVALAAGLFAAGFLIAYIYEQRWFPPLATDSLVYQLSTPVFWMRRQALAIFPTWYWNPANSYAPQASTMWFVWLLEPFKSDVLARFAQAPAILWIFVLMYRGFAMRGDQRLGNRDVESDPKIPGGTHGRSSTLSLRPDGDARATAALIAMAAVLSRPLFSEALFAKDDLIVTALFLTALSACSQTNLRDRFGPWRLGIALGLMLASKYTVLLVCPLFLFLVDAPFRAGWKRRDYAIAVLLAVVLAGPWYVRNMVLTGDPLFPADVKLFDVRLFTGLFGTERDAQLRSAGGIWRMLASTYHSLPIPLLVALALSWLAACAAAGRSLLIDPMRRATLIGAMAVLLLFFLASPHHEVRYLFPLIALWFDSASLAITHWIPRPSIRLVTAVLMAGISVATSFKIVLLQQIAQLSITAACISVAGIALLLLLHHRPTLAGPVITAGLLIGATGIYVYWRGYLTTYRGSFEELWSMGYADETPVWTFVRDETQVPAQANVAFANTQFTYPLYGFNFQRDVGYAPTRRGLHSFLKFPRMGDKVPGDLIVQTMTRLMIEDPDRQTWLENLQAMQARYLVVFRHELVENPIELRFAAEDPAKFVVRYQDHAAVVFEIKQ